MTLMTQTIPVIDVPFVQDGLLRLPNGTLANVFKLHPDARCDMCESRYGNERAHPRFEDSEDLVTICGGILVRLVDGAAID